MGNVWSQSFFIATPEITEKNVPDQSGRVHIVTGGYAGCGLELCKILYAANATVYVAGRSESKAQAGLTTIRNYAPTSSGRVSFMHLDLADLPTIKPAVQSFLASESRLDVLTLNAGVMFPPSGSVTAQNHELQIGTNCLGSWHLYSLLRPVLASTASSSPPASVRVTWAASLAVDTISPSPGGIAFASDAPSAAPQVLGPQRDYGQSKAGNALLAAEAQRRHGAADRVLHVAWNPGNLATELGRHLPGPVRWALHALLTYPAVFGAYTELWAAVSPRLTESHGGGYVVPWGQVGGVREDVARGMRGVEEGGLGTAARLWDWCESAAASFA